MFNTIKKGQIFYAFFVVVILFIGLITRTYLIKNHFSHIDDLGVAKSILEAHQDIAIKLGNLSSECHGHINNIFDKSCYQSFKKLAHSTLRSFHTIPINWTYAPLQFYFTNLLIFENLSYEELKILGRLPSFIFEMLGVYCLMKLLIQKYKLKIYDQSMILPLILAMFSWEAIIFSAQMESYAIGILTGSIFLYLLNSEYANIKLRKNAVYIGIMLGILVYAQYQSLIFVPGFYFAAVYKLCKSMNDLKRLSIGIIESVSCFMATFLLLPYRFLKDKTGLGINWNAGPNNEFAIPIFHQYSDPIAAIVEPISLFIKNYSVVLVSMLSPSNFEFQYLGFITTILVALSIIGYFSFFDKKSRENTSIAVFITTSIVFWIILIGLHKLSFGPTRHSIILIPIFILSITQGSIYLTNFSKYLKYSINFFNLFLFAVFIQSINTELKIRKDHFDESNISELLKKYSVNSVMNYDSSYSPYIMKDIKNHYPIINSNIYMGIRNFDSFRSQKYGTILPTNLSPQVIAFYSHFSPLDFKIHQQVISLIKKELSPEKPLKSELLYSEEIFSDVQIDWSKKTSNGANAFYFYIYKFY